MIIPPLKYSPEGTLAKARLFVLMHGGGEKNMPVPTCDTEGDRIISEVSGEAVECS